MPVTPEVVVYVMRVGHERFNNKNGVFLIKELWNCKCSAFLIKFRMIKLVTDYFLWFDENFTFQLSRFVHIIM